MKSNRTRWLGVGVALVVIPLVGAGCLQSDGGNESPVALAASAAEGESWVEAWDHTGPPQLPDIGELEGALRLTAEQKAVVQAALNEWQANVRERMANRGERGRGEGPRGRHGMPGAAGDFEPPLLGFLEDVVPALDASQVESLVELLPSKNRPEAAGRGGPGGRGGHRGGPGGGFLADVLRDLDLSAEQMTALRDAGQESREAFHDLREQFADGSITAEQLRDQAKVLRQAMETELASILSESQLAALEQAMAEHREEVTARRLEHLEEGMERRAEFLSNVLELDDAQAARVASILDGTLAERRAILTALGNGEIEIEDALYQGYQLAEATADSIRQVLTGEQAAVFDALKRMLPGHRGPHGP